MKAIEVAQNNLNSWNRHDAAAIVAAFAEGGIYRTPRVNHDLTGQAIGEFAKSVWTAFPDVSLEVIQGLPSFRLRAIRFARSMSTLTGRRWLSCWGSNRSETALQGNSNRTRGPTARVMEIDRLGSVRRSG
jgi:nuclear transport factor 2 (NTF2) superfamily protein